MPENRNTHSGNFRGWEYAKAGDYHRNLDLNWSYAPTYLQKMKHVRSCLENLPANSRVLDVGCGEGLLVEEYLKKGLHIEGLDLNYESEFVRRGDVLALPYATGFFDAVVFLDVFEHLQFQDQPKALLEIKRVLKPQRHFLMSAPNLAHLNARFWLALYGKLDRSDVETNHPGERPLRENMALLNAAGFEITAIKGITLTVPWLYRSVICKHPARMRWLHDWLQPLARPSLALLNLFYCRPNAKT